MSKLNLDLFKMGYFILYKSEGGLFSKGIEKRQLIAGINPAYAPYTHIEVSGGGKHSVNISPLRAKFIEITKTHKDRTVALVRYKNEDYEKGKRYKVAYFSAVLCNRYYDFRGILSFIFKWIKQNKNKSFCSEGAAWALQKVFPLAGNSRKSSEWMPAHFIDSPEFETVWMGKIE